MLMTKKKMLNCNAKFSLRKIRDRNQRKDIGKYSFVYGTIKNWNQLPSEALGTFTCKPTFLEKVL
jgi:hypothetical protein